MIKYIRAYNYGGNIIYDVIRDKRSDTYMGSDLPSTARSFMESATKITSRNKSFRGEETIYENE